jgi:hypothetical protein
MEIGILLQGQSNIARIAALDSTYIQTTVESLLGFDGVTNKVNMVGAPGGGSTVGAIVPGTAFLPTTATTEPSWVTPDGSGGFTNGIWETLKLYALSVLPPDEKAEPTSIVWGQNEFDSLNPGLTAAEWEAAITYDASQVRATLGQTAATTPYLFVDSFPYVGGVASSAQAEKLGFEALAADPSFNGAIAARGGDLDMNGDLENGANYYGGPHMSAADAMIMARRIAVSVANEFSQYAVAGSPIATAGGTLDSIGAEASGAAPVDGAAGALLVTFAPAPDSHGLAALGAAAAAGTGWSIIDNATTLDATSARLLDPTHLLLTFAAGADWDAAAQLYYGYGEGRLAAQGDPAEGNALYDDQGEPAWAPATGVSVDTSGVQIIDETDDVPAGAPGIFVAGAANTLVECGDQPFAVLAGSGFVTIEGAGGSLVAAGDSGQLDACGGTGDVELFGGTAGGNRLASGSGNAILVGGGNGDVFVVSGAGTHEVWGGVGTGTTIDASGSMGADIYVGGAGENLIQSGAGNDTAFAGFGAATVTGGAGADIIVGGNGPDMLNAGANSTIWGGGSGADTIALGDGEAIAIAGSAGTQVIGGNGAGTVFDGQGGISITGGAGSLMACLLGGGDTVSAGGGNMTLFGGSGAADVFGAANGVSGCNEFVSGFREGTDHIHLAGYGAGAVGAAIAAASSATGGTVLHLAGSATIWLFGVSAVSAGDFI